MTQPVLIQVPPKKAAGFWTPWGNVRVPDLDRALEKKPVRTTSLRPNEIEPKPVAPLRRG